jgi:hypothetical protein
MMILTLAGHVWNLIGQVQFAKLRIIAAYRCISIPTALAA